MRRLLPVLALVLMPDLAAACAACIDSAYGNRGFSWPFVGLMLAPFAVVAALAGIFVYGGARLRRRPRPAGGLAYDLPDESSGR